MELAREIHARFSHTRSLELLPAFLLPPERAADGWADIDGHLGVCAKRLAAAYAELCARGDDVASPEASLLAMLATTENLRAVNARKRLCLAGAVAPAEELHILDVLLSSHLYKHTKSPMLWSHRRWLLDTLAPPTTLERECAIVAAAAERHPKNYYAWAYMRWWCAHAGVLHSAEMPALVAWAARLGEQNLSDVSVWTFVAWLDVPELHELAQRTSAQAPGHPAILAATSPPADSIL